MKYLKKRGYFTIDCNDFYLWYRHKIELPEKSVLITFDDGTIGQLRYGMPILKRYNMKGTFFIIGKLSYNNNKNYISYNEMSRIKKIYPNCDFQSHTFNFHRNLTNHIYNKTLEDELIQKKYYNFRYLAYPFGYFNSEMKKAYKDCGIKMAFTFGKNGFATRMQDIYSIKRIKINSLESFSEFKKWFI